MFLEDKPSNLVNVIGAKDVPKLSMCSDPPSKLAALIRLCFQDLSSEDPISEV